MRHGLVQRVLVELAFGKADHDTGDAVADQVGQCAALAHELVDADQDGDRLNRNIGHDRQRRGERDEAGAGDAGRALRGDHGDAENAELLPNRQMGVGGLRQEQRRQRHVDVGAVEIETVAGRHHKADHRARGAKMLHLLDHLRQHRLRRRGAEHDQELVLDIGDEADDGKARQPRDRAEHDQHEQDAGEIEGRDQRRQVDQRAEAVGTDREGHRAERA
ncbi:hypothetical protein chiPu_0030770, partial [Chiloscyllium punctatum]|nr:hypothetical protein [Chiloscyllium punctatum]